MIKLLQEKPGWKVLVAVSFISVVFNFYASSILNKSYEESQFPVPYYEAQLSFSDENLKGWYEFLVQNNTMDIYISTQNIDFLFILSVLILHFSVILLLSRVFVLGSRLRKYLVYAALVSASAPIFDALENGVSYIMIANYSDFSSWLAILYSSFAAAKFAMFSFAYLLVPMGVLAWVVLKVKSITKSASKGAANGTA